MTVDDVINKCGLNVFCKANGGEVTSIYCCDLLSNALVKLEKGAAWLTVMNNVNVAAVAYSNNASCVILTEGITPTTELLAKAEEYGISILGSKYDSYKTICLLYDIDR